MGRTGRAGRESEVVPVRAAVRQMARLRSQYGIACLRDLARPVRCPCQARAHEASSASQERGACVVALARRTACARDVRAQRQRVHWGSGEGRIGRESSGEIAEGV